jgi:tRNA(adenine34) deaminase
MFDFESLDHESFMKEALQCAREARRNGDLPIGAVIVCDGEVVSRGRNAINSRRTQLHHAEIDALTNAREIVFRRHEDCVVYTTVEPCVMCLGTIVMADIRHVVFGAFDGNRGGTDMWRNVPYVGKEILRYEGGVLEAECTELAGDLLNI